MLTRIVNNYILQREKIMLLKKMFILNTKVQFFLLIILTNQIFSQTMFSQDRSIVGQPAKSNISNKATQSLEQIQGGVETDFSMSAISERIKSLDNIVNPNLYYLGTGDVFTINIWGKTNRSFIANVNSENEVVIPNVGIVDVNGKTLYEGKLLILAKLKKIFKEDKISIALLQVKKFKVYILGEIKSPGNYYIEGTTRVSDLINLAGSKEILNRNIEICNPNYPKRFADMALFFNNNDIDKNPYLTLGDRVFIHSRKEFISIFGAVNIPNIYDWLPGDSLLTILNVAGGLTREADSSRIIITRFADNKDSLINFKISLHDSSAYSFPIGKDDKILVCEIPEYRKHRIVTINGEVKYPGVYPVQKDKTRLLDVLNMAGGLTKDAFLKGSKIVRKSYISNTNREFERVKKMPSRDLTPLERSYLKTKLIEEEGIISLDFEELIKEGYDLYNIILRDGDIITITRKSLSVQVSGAVILPGLVSYKEGEEYKYYINQAGGFNTRAKKSDITIIKGGNEIWLKPRKVKEIKPGDAVWVPEKEYRDKFQILKDAFTIIGSTAMIIVSYFTIKDYLSGD